MSADHATRLNTEPADTAQMFVINLCASTSPMALSHPNTPELKRFTFFVSRQREEGRERFRHYRERGIAPETHNLDDRREA